MPDDEPQTWDDLAERMRKLKAPVEAEYRAAVAPLARRRTEDSARIEREYAEKMRLAKSDLAAAQRRFKETWITLKRWRDASIAAIETEFRSAKAPALLKRRNAMTPIYEWDEVQRTRLEKLGPDAWRKPGA
jgi:hypothetical protein